MDRTLSEVFPELVTDEKRRIMDDSVVTKISASKDRSLYRFHVNLPGIVSKRRIRKMEDAIKSKYFKNTKSEVKIIERFSLPEGYTPEMAFKEYKDSMFEEVHDSDRLLYVILKNSKFDFIDDKNLDTLTIGNDGNTLSGIFDKKTKYTLKRTK